MEACLRHGIINKKGKYDFLSDNSDSFPPQNVINSNPNTDARVAIG